jgi:DNA-binding NtrC family response regulator
MKIRANQEVTSDNLRKILVLGLHSEQIDVLSWLHNQKGWQIDVAYTPYKAEQRVLLEGHRVGLVLLRGDEPTAWVDHACRRLVSPCIEWIALVVPGLLAERRYAELVTTRCFDYHTLPVEGTELARSLGHAHGMATLAHDLIGTTGNVSASFGLVGDSEEMRAVFSNIKKMAGAELPVLITGESGTGKEQIAKAIHQSSHRSRRRFVAMNCAALAPDLVSSELFGHERGAFTGAHRRKIGRLEIADGGTILLDEVGDLPHNVQVSLLRFLEEGTLERVGSAESVPVDVRVIAATHVDLEAAVSQGRFREDLYHRLNVLRLDVPPLRARNGDIEPLAHHFLREYKNPLRGRAQGFSKDAMAAMQQNDWRGNVRELQNRVRQAVVLSENRLISRNDLMLERRAAPRHLISLKQARDQAERRAILASLDYANGCVSAAAVSLGISRNHLYTLIERHGIEMDRPGSSQPG